MLKILDCLFGTSFFISFVISFIASTIYVFKLLSSTSGDLGLPLNKDEKRRGYLGMAFFVVLIFTVIWIKNYQ